MRILILSFYYQPDLCAGCFRATSFVKALQRHLTQEDAIEVVTTFPNRYLSFRRDTVDCEQDGNVTIKRVRIPGHRSGFFDQTIAFGHYFFGALRYVRRRDYDLVFATSSRLFTAFLGAVIARRKMLPLYLDIRDIFVDTMRSVLKNPVLRAGIPFFGAVERYTIRQATKVNLISPGFAPYFKKRYDRQFLFFSHGIDETFQDFTLGASEADAGDKKKFLYAGNIGEGQGLEKIVPAIAATHPGIEFTVLGDGGRKEALADAARGLSNVRILPPVGRDKLREYYAHSDVLFLHLNDCAAFEKVLPSKIFEYVATFKPIVAGINGYARSFLQENVPDSLIFDSCDVKNFSKKYEHFSGRVDVERRRNFIARFFRDAIMDQMAESFLAMVDRQDKREK